MIAAMNFWNRNCRYWPAETGLAAAP